MFGKNRLRVLMMLLFMVIFTLIPVKGAAAEVHKNFSVEVETEKSQYAKDEEVVYRIKVTNISERDAEDIVINDVLPSNVKVVETDGIISDEGISWEIPSLKSNEQRVLNLKISLINDEDGKNGISGKLPSTGGSGTGGMIITAGSLIILGILLEKRRNKKSVIASALAFVMTTSILAAGYTDAYAQTSGVRECFTHTIKIGDVDVVSNIIIEANMITIGGDEGELIGIEIDRSIFIYDENTEIYYLFDAIDKITGRLEGAEDVVKAYYVVENVQGTLMKEGTFEAASNWSINDIGFIMGENILRIVCEYHDGSEVWDEIIINNFNEDNIGDIEVDMNDDDNDGVINYIEDLYGTDKNKADTDGDGLSDYVEIADLGTDPLEGDTDNNGILDGDEDCDEDGISNSEEIRLGSYPISNDSDYDGLKDSEELEIGTDLMNEDTDGDGLSDYYEYINGLDPLVPNSLDAVIEKSFTEKDFNVFGGEIGVQVDLSASLRDILTFKISMVDDNILDSSIPGYIGEAYDLTIDGTFNAATLTMEFDEALLSQEDFVPAIYYYNEEMRLLEEVEGQVINGNKVTVSLSHFSKYIILNKTTFEKIWDTSIRKPGEAGNSQDMDIVFTLDKSHSMVWNDPEDLRKTLTNDFIDRLGENDRVAVVQFARTAEVLNNGAFAQTKEDKEYLKSLVNGIVNNDGYDSNAGTNGTAGLYASINTFDNISEDRYKCIVFLTDGDDTHSDYYYSYIIDLAKEKNIKIFTIGLSQNVNNDRLQSIAEETGGAYFYSDEAGDLYSCFDDIIGETIDFSTDSNYDGICDYYTKLICEGKLRSGEGKRIFGSATYEEIQENNDFDGDDLLNGEELEISLMSDNSTVYLKVKSNPNSKDSDCDGNSDDYEVMVYDTDPLKSNAVIDVGDVDRLTDSEFYISDSYKDSYDDEDFGWMRQGGIWIGNKIFGTTYDVTMLYQGALVDYFERINESAVEEKELQGAAALTFEYMGTISGIAEEVMDEYNKINKDIPDALKVLLRKVESLEGAWLNVPFDGFEATDDFYDLCNELFADYNKALSEVPELQQKVNLIDKFEVYSKAAGRVSCIMDAVNLGFSFKENYDEFIKFKSNLQVVNDNIYILEDIIKNSDCNELKNAANRLKDALEEDLKAGIDGFMESDYFAEGFVINEAIGTVLHAVIGFIPYVKYVELARNVLDFVFNFSGISKECVKLYAIATSADILGNSFKSYISNNSYNGNEDYKAVYTEAEVALTKITNLALARISSESQMIATNKEHTVVSEWLVAKYLYSNDLCESHIVSLENDIKYYRHQRVSPL